MNHGRHQRKRNQKQDIEGSREQRLQAHRVQEEYRVQEVSQHRCTQRICLSPAEAGRLDNHHSLVLRVGPEQKSRMETDESTPQQRAELGPSS